jgi:hypothetical protein
MGASIKIRDVGTSMCLSASAITNTTDIHRRDSNTRAKSTSPKVRHLHGKLPRKQQPPTTYTQIAALCPEAAEMLLRVAPTTPRCGLSILLAFFFSVCGHDSEISRRLEPVVLCANQDCGAHRAGQRLSIRLCFCFFLKF